MQMEHIINLQIADYKREGEVLRDVANSEGYSIDEATGDLLIAETLSFEQLAVDVDGDKLSGPTNLIYSYMCEIDHGVEDAMVNHEGRLLWLI